MMTSLCDRFGDTNVLYSVFGFALLLFLVLDIGLMQRSYKPMTIRSAFIQAACWIALALGFGYLMLHYHGKEAGFQYYSAYLTEYSLSMDNIFVFILILRYFKVSEQYYHKVLFYGIIGAVIFRAIFIFVGIAVVSLFHWVLYIFGALLVYTGFKILISGEGDQFDPGKNIVYRFLRKNFPILKNEGEGNFIIRRNKKRYLSILFVVIAVIASADVLFAIDSIPAVFAISQDKLVIITSNVFAVMGLRAMFFILSHATNKFDYLQEGIALVLIFIGAKMLVEIFHIEIATQWSLVVIVSILAISIVISIFFDKPKKEGEK